ncbi:EamA family transporter [Stappia sp. ES.058]|uniref:EamA family transporter n=1 Tax=Stappia sp. ES.058 TaxID=1881061 RepID=UPI000879A4BD|nr:EamA family transporter [Stappia sp. ES.058]SDU17654.1 probable blue pigment (indigoidine) exporter [Stappia sp. ES.058]
MARILDVFATALAPAIWGSTYIVTTELLPPGHPLTLAVLRALPAGLLLLAVVRQLPPPQWIGRILVLGALNFAVFWSLLFVAAYRLPGGVAATLGAVQPLLVLFLARVALGNPVTLLSVGAALAGLCGVALLVVGPAASLDPVGVLAGLGGAAAMAGGTVFSRKWQSPVSLLTFTAWQLTAGGFLLLPVALWVEPPLPSLTAQNVAGFAYLGLIGAALTYYLWFRGIARLEPGPVSALGFLSPAIAVLLGWIVLEEQLTAPQIAGALVVLASVWAAQAAGRRAALPPRPARAA